MTAEPEPSVALRWLIGQNPVASVYGLLLIGSLLAAENAPTIGFLPLIGGVALALTLYWLAHGYAQVLGSRVESRERLSLRFLVTALVHEWAIARAAVLPLLTLTIAGLAGASVDGAVIAAISSCAVAILALELLAGVGQGLSAFEILVEAGIGATMGLGLFAERILLH